MKTIEILGFDRIGFVDEVTKTVSNFGRISKLKFDADGVKAHGKVVFKLENDSEYDRLLQYVKAIRGLVKVAKID